MQNSQKKSNFRFRVSVFSGLETKKHLINGPLADGLFENYCIQETVKTFYNKGKTPSIYYLRTHNKLRIDLIIEKNMKIYPFEIEFAKKTEYRYGKSDKKILKSILLIGCLVWRINYFS
jgi:hypothetical protein